MNPKWEGLYNDMQADIARCLALGHPEKENVENCFWIARNYWEQLQVAVNRAGFNGERDEIEFFREVKPRFAGYIEYFSLLSEALQFEPPNIPLPDDLSGKLDEADWTKAWLKSVRDYWMAEEGRGNRFYTRHQVFLNYCESNSSEHDSMYFLPLNSLPGDITQRRVHNRDTTLFTAHEELLTSWHAYKLYREYIKKRIYEPAHG